MLKIYNTLHGAKEEFLPMQKGEIKMYTCGVTVYDHCHIGHGRSLYVFSVMKKYLEIIKGFKVTLVRNITDIDDKILNKAVVLAGNEGLSIEDAWNKVVDVNVKSYYEDLENLGLPKADYEPCASGYIREITQFIQALIKKGFAYEAHGSVYFRIRKYHQKFSSYGELSGKKIDDLLTGVRIDEDLSKEDPLDFALWKAKKENEVGWTSPWGEGRPGWHIECSVMATGLLGNTFDIHGGGKDLVFPHHENEIAQSKAKTSKEFARYWVHHGLLTINSQKMAKSLGNFITLKDAIARYSADALKIFYLSAHYHSPLDFSEEKMKEVLAVKRRIHILRDHLKDYKEDKTLKSFSHPEIQKIHEKFIECMDDDFNMPESFSVLFDIIPLVNNSLGKDPSFFIEAKTLVNRILDVFFLSHQEKTIAEEMEEKIELRKALRKEKKFKEADALRDELSARGIILEDLPNGKTVWRIQE